jgi:hypothetical protein
MGGCSGRSRWARASPPPVGWYARSVILAASRHRGRQFRMTRVVAACRISLAGVPGIFTLAGMGLQIPPGGLVVSIGDGGGPQMEVKQTLLRLDLWPTWLEIGCVHAEQARSAGERLSPGLSDAAKYTSLSEELQASLVAVTAFAFTFDGFYDTLRHELGAHPHQRTWKAKRTSRDAQLTETMRHHLKLGPRFSQQLRTVIKELFEFRSSAVHPSSQFVEPNYRPQIDSGVHPHLITFSGPHAVQCRALALELLDRLIARAAELSTTKADTAWLDRGRKEVDRLSALYRVTGDDLLAFPPPPSRA